MTIPVVQLQENLEMVREQIAAAARRGGRRPEDVTLVAVSKTHPPESVVAAYRLGVRQFGENRVEEGNPKIEAITCLLGDSGAADPPLWHMIGHVQSRKAQEVVGRYVLVHSVDHLRLARRLERQAAKQGLTVDVLLEINVSGEESKYGFAPESCLQSVPELLTMPHLNIRGLMTMAPIVPDPQLARPVFSALREFRDELRQRYPDVAWEELSMGMSDDFEVAVEEGATLVRIGRAIFGERET